MHTLLASAWLHLSCRAPPPPPPHPTHLFLHPDMLLLLPVPLILAFVEEWPAHLLLALLDLLQETQLTHLLDQVLVLLLLLGYLLLLQLLLSLLLLEVLLGFLMLFDLLDEEAATDAARTTILPRPVLDEESTEGVILTLGGLGARSGYGLGLTTWKAV